MVFKPRSGSRPYGCPLKCQIIPSRMATACASPPCRLSLTISFSLTTFSTLGSKAGRARISSSRVSPLSQSSFITDRWITDASSPMDNDMRIAFSSSTCANSEEEYFWVPPRMRVLSSMLVKPVFVSSISTSPAFTRIVKSIRGSSRSNK